MPRIVAVLNLQLKRMNLSFLVIVLTIAALQVNPTLPQESSTAGTIPLLLPAIKIAGDKQTCPIEEQLKVGRSQIEIEVGSKLDYIIEQIKQLQVSREQPSPCGGPDWTRVAYLNMNYSWHDCPSGWLEYTTPIRVCGRQREGGGCDSVTYSSEGNEYQYVCGRMLGYQYGLTLAFWPFTTGGHTTIETSYVDGISMTHGSPREHIWTFASGFDEGSGSDSDIVCPCANPDPILFPAPLFVGSNYFCESGTETYTSADSYYVTDPLWDGQECGETSRCCSYNSPPWFTVELAISTTDDIEIRICGFTGPQSRDVRVQLLEVFIR